MRIRAPRALAAAALTTLLLATSVVAGGITSIPEAPGGPLPAMFRLPAERVGDAVQYSLSVVDLDPRTDAATVVLEHPIMGYEWMAPGPALAWDLSAHDANHLHKWGWQPDGEGQWEMYAQPVYAVAKADRRVLSYSYLHNEDLVMDGERFLHVPGPDAVFTIPCGPASHYSGKQVPLERPVTFFGDCSWPNYWSPGKEFKAVASQRIGDLDTVLFTAAHWDGSNQQHLWLSQDLPYPVRIASQDQDDPQRWYVFSLTSFRRGVGDPITWDGGAIEPPQELELAPAGLHGTDERGIDHPFPLSAALEATREDGVAQDFWRVLDGGGYIALARYHETSGEASTFQWLLAATDGTAWEAIEVSRTVGPVAMPWPHPLLQQALTGAAVEVRPWDQEPIAAPPTSGVPEEWPTVRALWGLWARAAGEAFTDKGPNAWGWTIQCGNADCTESFIEFSAGLELEEEFAAAGGPFPVDDVGRIRWHSGLQVVWDPLRGDSWGLYEYRHATGDVPATSDPMPEVGNPAVQDGSEVRTFAAIAWVTPTGPWVAASGALALLSGLAYLLWPVLKGGAVGLFSRVRDERVLEHPTRAAIVQIVEARPGIHVREVGRVLGANRSPLAHHLRKLVAARRLREVRANGVVCLFPGGTPAADGAAHAALRTPAARHVLAAVAQRPRTVREVAAATRLASSTAAYHLERLRSVGLVGTDGTATALGLRLLQGAPGPGAAARPASAVIG